MKIIGLTGGIACGKSTVSAMLKELGAYAIDADKVGHKVLEEDSTVQQAIKTQFGIEYFLSEGVIDRKKLGELVFSDPIALEKLNSIVHPIILRNIKSTIDKIKETDQYSVLVVDAALLIETGCNKLVDEIWLVILPYNIQLERLIKRDKLTKEQAEQRISSQMRQEEKIKLADVIIDNSNDISITRKQLESLWRNL